MSLFFFFFFFMKMHVIFGVWSGGYINYDVMERNGRWRLSDDDRVEPSGLKMKETFLFSSFEEEDDGGTYLK